MVGRKIVVNKKYIFKLKFKVAVLKGTTVYLLDYCKKII